MGARPSLRAQPSLSTTPCSTLPLLAGAPQECGLQLSKGTSTTTPNHPHNTHSLHVGKRPRAGASNRGAWGNRRVTQPVGGRTYGGWRRAADARSASIQGGNTPHGGGGSIAPTGPGRPLRPGWKIGSMIGGAPQGAQPYLGGWGRQGCFVSYRCVMWFKGHGPSKSGARGECLKIGTWYDPKIPSSKGTKLFQKFEFLGLGESAISRR